MIRTSLRGGVVELAIDRPPANALNLELVTALGGALAQAGASGASAIVLTGRPGMFSAGVDVPELLSRPRAEVAEFWRGFLGLIRSLAASPIPVIAAVSGHAPAGGAVLAIHCDYRIGARGSFRIGLNEVAVGLPVPEGIYQVLAHVVGTRVAERLATTAELVQVEEALRLGLLDELVEAETLLDRARERAAQLTALPPVAMNRTRLQARAALLRGLDPGRDAAAATEAWFSAETQAAMQALVRRLAGK